MQKGQPRPEAFRLFAPTQRAQPLGLHLGAQGGVQHFCVRRADHLLVQNDGADPSRPPDHRPTGRFARHPVLDGDKTRQLGFHRLRIQRRRQPHPVAHIAAAKFGDRQPRGARQMIRRLQHGAASAGQQELAGPAPRPRDPLREGLGQQQSRMDRLARPAARRPGPAIRQLQRIARARRPIPRQADQTVRQIDARSAQPRLAQHRGDPSAGQGVAPVRGDRDHMGQAWRQRDFRQPHPMFRQSAIGLQRTQPAQHLARLGHRASGRRVQQRQSLDRPRAPSRQIQRKAGQVRLLDFGPLVRDQPPRLLLVPEAIADARRRAPRPPAPLFGRGPADLDRRQPRQAAGRFETRHARQAAIDHHPHALDGQTGFGNRGGQHQLAPSRRRRFDGAVLLGAVQPAVKRRDVHVGQPQPFPDQTRDAVNLTLPRQEDQNRPALFAQGGQAGPRHRLFEPLGRIAAQVSGFDWKHPPLGLDHRRAIQQTRDADHIQRRRHDQQPQIVAQQPLCLARQRQAQVGVQTAFVKLVEQDRAHALQPRIVQDHAREHALGDDLDPGRRPDTALQPCAITDRPPGLLA